MNRSRIITIRDGKVYHTLFHDNMLILMEFYSVPSDLKRCFKMDMFAIPNVMGFMHVSHFLLKIIYPNTNEFRDCWPVFEKSQERDFRNKATKLLRGIRTDFPNFQFPEIIPSKFLSPGGFWFIIVMWNLTVLAMQVQAKRDLGCSLLYKPSGKLKEINEPYAIKFWNLFTGDNYEEVEKVKLSMKIFRKDFIDTKQIILDKLQKSKLYFSQFISDLEKNKFWEAIDGNQKNEVIHSDSNVTVSSLGNKCADANAQVAHCIQPLNVDFIRNLAEIIDLVKNREGFGNNYVIDGKNVVDGDSGEVLPPKHLKNDFDLPGEGNPIRLLDYFCKPLEELKSMKLDWKRETLPFQLRYWETIHKENEKNKNEMSRMELLLNNKLTEINVKYNRERDLPAEVPESPKSILSDGKNVCTSTPIRDNNFEMKPLDITPHKKPLPGDYFDETYREILVELSRKTQSDNTEQPVKPNFSGSTLEELRERLKKFQQGMKKE